MRRGTWRLQVVPPVVWEYLVQDWERAEQLRLMEEAAAAARRAEMARQCVHCPLGPAATAPLA